MADRNKVIKGLECCMDILHAGPGWSQGCIQCPYAAVVDVGRYPCMRLLANEALELLKEQEPVKPRYEDYFGHRFAICENCGNYIMKYEKYCAGCGRKVKWDG